MKEREQHVVSTQYIREDAERILDQSRELLTVDYNSIKEVLTPAVGIFKNEAAYVTPITQPIEAELGFTLFFDTVNFCFKDPATKHEYEYSVGGKTVKRSSGLAAAMMASGIDWNDLANVAGMDRNKWRELTQISAGNPMFLGDERGQRISTFAENLLKSGKKTVTDYIAAAEGDGMKMLTLLADSRFFDDEFLKRAQLTVRMFNDIYRKYGAGEFKKIDQLTAMADYRLPQVFYNLGAVKLSGNLLVKLLDEEPIKPNGREERAIRATVITVSEKLSKIMGINECDIDTLLWNLSQKMAKEKALPIPHMIVATDKY